MVMYMAEVIAFFLAGRLNWIRRILPERSVTMSLIFAPPVAADSKSEACGTAPLARKPSISSVVKPSSFSTSSLCSPIPGARLAGTLVTPCT